MQNVNSSRFGTTWRQDQFVGETAFRNMRLQFAEAAAARPWDLREFFYAFAGRTVHARIVGRELADNIDAPFCHLRIDGAISPPELTIELWDDNKIRQNPVPVDLDEGWHESTVKSCDQRFIGERLPHTFCCLDRETNQIVGSIAWHQRIFIYERAKPLRRVLVRWHNDRNIQIIHAGLVARHNSGILFAGKSGSGKSTSSLACIMDGFDYLAEDYVGLQICGDSSFIGHSLYNSVFLKTDHLERFTPLAPYAIRGRLPHEEKSVIILSQIYPERLKQAVPIRALVIPHISDTEDTLLQPTSKREAFLSLAPSSLFQIPHQRLGIGGFASLAQLVEQIPCFRLELGNNLASIPRRLHEIFSDLSLL
jgi:hypothetical protein